MQIWKHVTQNLQINCIKLYVDDTLHYTLLLLQIERIC